MAGAVLCALCSTGAVAGTVYRWVDEQGKVHYAEVVPERYRNKAKPVDVTSNAPSAEQLPARELADWILADRLPVRFQLQLHKVLWGNVPGK